MARLAKTALALLGAALLAGPLAADWLVLTDGSRMETRGEWTEKGRLVVFTTTDGTLASLRLDAIDLEASRRATEAAKRPPPKPAAPPAAEPKQATFVLTDADVAHRLDTGGEDDDDASQAPAPGSERLVVTDWQESPMVDEAGTLITGTLRNVSSSATTSIRLTVLVYDANGELLASDNAMVSSQALMPDQQARFQVEFNGIYTIAAVSFRPTTMALDVGAPAGEPAAGGPEGAEESAADVPAGEEEG